MDREQADKKQDIVLLEVGRALNAWQRVEEQVCTAFAIAVGARHVDAARSAFARVYDNGLRRDMMLAALSTQPHAPELEKRWRKLSSKIVEESAFRNRLAHGTIWAKGPDDFGIGPFIYETTKIKKVHTDIAWGGILSAAEIKTWRTSLTPLVKEISAFGGLIADSTAKADAERIAKLKAKGTLPQSG